MSTSGRTLVVGGLPVTVVRKAIKNLHLGVYPPDGRVRVAAPLLVSDAAVRVAVIGKLRWIRRQKKNFAEQPRESRREMVSGESHYYLGRRYRLRVVLHEGPSRVTLRNGTTMELQVPERYAAAQRSEVLRRWYRQRLRELALPLLEKWEKRLGVRASALGIRKMKTKWGSCITGSRRIWLNLELAKKPIQCLDYLIAHELIHLLERHHNNRFKTLLDRYIPRWRSFRSLLNEAPLGHADWSY